MKRVRGNYGAHNEREKNKIDTADEKEIKDKKTQDNAEVEKTTSTEEGKLQWHPAFFCRYADRI